jgi:hypothetical protein
MYIKETQHLNEVIKMNNEEFAIFYAFKMKKEFRKVTQVAARISKTDGVKIEDCKLIKKLWSFLSEDEKAESLKIWNEIFDGVAKNY